MRHKAQPGDPKDAQKGRGVGIDEKLHVRVRVEGQEDGQEKILWFRKVLFNSPVHHARRVLHKTADDDRGQGS